MNSRIKEIRKSLNLLQKDFATKIGIKPSSLSDIENGKCQLTERNIILICQIFNVNEKWLRTGKGKMFNENEKQYQEFFEFFEQLQPPLQDFLINVAKDLLATQEKL